MKPFDSILGRVGAYYGAKVTAHGPTAPGVDWKSEESQLLRFRQLLALCDRDRPISINDYGCGYGALYDYLVAQGYDATYRGFDIAEEMIRCAHETHPAAERATFVSDAAALVPADYTICSGIFNVKMDIPEDAWKDYIVETLRTVARLSTRGFAFNMLTSYADEDKKRADLYYGSPLFFFDHCKREYSRFVSLLHDYPLYEFTILVRLGT